MTEIRKPAVKIMQGERTLLLTTFTVRDLMIDGFYNVDTLDVREGTGMQRVLNQTRANSFAKDVLKATDAEQAFLPTSVFLATSKDIGYDEHRRELVFETAGVCPLSVVDGQHRIEGLVKATKTNSALLDFPISVVIAPNLNENEQMLQFVTVNTKQQPVDEGVKQHIYSQFHNMIAGLSTKPWLPGWLERASDADGVPKALRFVIRLNGDEESPWHNRVTLADNPQKDKSHTIKQNTLVTVLKRHWLAGPVVRVTLDEEKQYRMIRNYWNAVRELFFGQIDHSSELAPFLKAVNSSPELDPVLKSVVFKYNGAHFFSIIAIDVFTELARSKKSYSVESIKECMMPEALKDTLEFLRPEYWQQGSNASGLNQAAIRTLTDKYRRAFIDLHQQSSDEIDL